MTIENKNSVDIAQQTDGSVVITFLARNTITATFAILLAGPSAFMCLILALRGVSEGQFVTSLKFIGACVGVLWIGWYFGWRKKRHSICFDDKGIQAGATRLFYDDVSEIVIDFNGGAPFDPGSMPVPRNTSPGYHVAVRARGQFMPITATISRIEAQTVRDLCEATWKSFTTRSPSR